MSGKVINKSNFMREWWKTQSQPMSWNEARPIFQRVFKDRFKESSDYQTFLRTGHQTNKITKRTKSKTVKTKGFADVRKDVMSLIKSQKGDFNKAREILRLAENIIKNKLNVDSMLGEIDSLQEFYEQLQKIAA